MKTLLKSAALSAVVLAAAGASPAVRADEVSELKAAVQALQKRIEELESRAQAVDDTNDRQTDQIAVAKSSVGSWVSNFNFKGDFRYRNETIDQEFIPQRNRDRIRARVGFTAKVNDTIRTEFQLSTSEGNDPRSPNVTLTGLNSRKLINLDLAYVEWQPLTDWRITAGKMRQPWLRPGQSVLIDGDINPEGLAVNYGHGDVFASMFYNALEERAHRQRYLHDRRPGGLEADHRCLAPDGRRRLLRLPERTRPGAILCRAQWQHRHDGGGQLQARAVSAAWSLITTSCSCSASGRCRWPVGRWRCTPMPTGTLKPTTASTRPGTPGSCTAGPAIRAPGKSATSTSTSRRTALFGQFVDSDFGGGNTDERGSAVKLGYAPAKNWVINVWYQFGQTNLDGSVNIPGVGQVYNRDYERLQVDLNFKY